MEVKIWQEQVVIPTYKAGEPEKNPMFFEKRVYQGSSGVVYPHPVIESIADEKTAETYIGLFLENRYLKIMILPEIGGRVQMAYDKIAGRHFIYYNQVIKPALVGLCGPWISGGIEFNWPQHHRPSTFEPVDFKIEAHADGSKTVWVNELEKMFRTKGLAGFTLHPDKAFLEIRVQLYNRTPLPQTFLWWANPAVKVNDHYQSVFPPDVHAVFDHGKRDVSTFPIATGTYYKVDYSPGTDISRYKNIPVPTSYMAVDSVYDFVGGYEHDTRAGVLHVADHHVAPGKKQWTWGNGDFGLAWDRNLTDDDGPYIELMTGVFTDNQPDFSWLMPYEEKSFTQYFLPYRELGIVKNATRDLLIGAERCSNSLHIKLFATSPQEAITLTLKVDGRLLFSEQTSLDPEEVYVKEIIMEARDAALPYSIQIRNSAGEELLSFQEQMEPRPVPEPAGPARLPNEISSTEELFLTGQHLEQYRHATYNPVTYYQEAIKREPGDVRNNNALGAWLLRRGQFADSLPHFKTAIASLTQRNPNPYDSEPYYNLGLALKFQGRFDEAYEAFFKAAWTSAWQDPAYFSVAQIDLRRKKYALALEHINWSIDSNARNGKAYLVKIHALRKLGRPQAAITTAEAALVRDGFNLSAIYELYRCYLDLNNTDLAWQTLGLFKQLSRQTSNNLIECSIEFAELGLYAEALDILNHSSNHKDPMLKYYAAFYAEKTGDDVSAKRYWQEAANLPPDYCFPNRLDDILILQRAISKKPEDSRAPYYLGNLWYDKRQYQQAIAQWTVSSTKDPLFPTVFRNLGIAAYNQERDTPKALLNFEKAYSLNPADARILMELDQLYKKLNYPAQTRLEFLTQQQAVAFKRDDVYLEIAALNNYTGNFSKALQMIENRKFHPWEGGEGKVSGQYIYALTALAKVDIGAKRFQDAIDKLYAAQVYPDNLGEGKLPGAQENDIFYWLGVAYAALANQEQAIKYWQKATIGGAEPSAAIFYNDQQPDQIYYQGLAWQQLHQTDVSRQIFTKLIDYGQQHQHDEVRIDYFAVSLPDLLIFEDDLNRRNFIHCQYITGLGYLGLNQLEQARNAWNTVLENDAMHFGASTHLKDLLAQKSRVP